MNNYVKLIKWSEHPINHFYVEGKKGIAIKQEVSYFLCTMQIIF